MPGEEWDGILGHPLHVGPSQTSNDVQLLPFMPGKVAADQCGREEVDIDVRQTDQDSETFGHLMLLNHALLSIASSEPTVRVV